jgi:hypothetical protein
VISFPTLVQIRAASHAEDPSFDRLLYRAILDPRFSGEDWGMVSERLPYLVRGATPTLLERLASQARGWGAKVLCEPGGPSYGFQAGDDFPEAEASRRPSLIAGSGTASNLDREWVLPYAEILRGKEVPPYLSVASHYLWENWGDNLFHHFADSCPFFLAADSPTPAHSWAAAVQNRRVQVWARHELELSLAQLIRGL